MTTSRLTFSWIDYSFFSILIGVSMAIGVYFGCFHKQNSTTDYYLGGKKMNYLPIAMSILASHVSGMTLLGVPTEVYVYGSQYFAVVLTVLFMSLATIFIFLPVFAELQMPSIFGYLEVRFNRTVRKLCSVLYILTILIVVPIVVYVPALAFSQVTAFSVHLLAPVLCVVCITYTTIGGLKALVWTDTIQISVICGGLCIIIVLGLRAAGGLFEVFRIADEGGRLILFDMNPSPFERSTFWGISIGLTFHFISHVSISPSAIQRCLAVPTKKAAVRSIIFMGFGICILKVLCTFIGVMIYAHYHDCDPLTTKAIERHDQLFPHYVMDVAGHLPGLPGLVLAGLVSSALSLMSSCLSVVSGTVYEDFISPMIGEGPRKEAIGASIMKVIVVIFGCITCALVFIVEHLGTVFQMAIALKALIDGPILGLFVLGMMVPWVKTRGAVTGTILSIGLMMWLILSNQWYQYQGLIRDEVLPVAVHGCEAPWNNTVIPTLKPIPPEDAAPMVYRISFLYYTLIGFVSTIVMSIITSFMIGETDVSGVDRRHITPFMRRFIPELKYSEVPLKEVPPIVISSSEKNGVQ